MRSSCPIRPLFPMLLAITLASVPAGAQAFQGRNVPYDPVIDPARFTTNVNNPYFPLVPGTTYTFTSVTTAGTETDVVMVTNNTRVTMGVTTLIVHDAVSLDGSLTEDTFDWYAQDVDGNVWYFGEDARQYDHGTLLGNEGSWEGGVGGAKPGIIMEANPRKGDAYRQEYLPGVAEDFAKVVNLGMSVTVPYGTFVNCLETADSSTLEHGAREEKFFCPGLGNVLEVSPKGGRVRNELVGVSP